jgi:hypothetical protein
MIEKFVADLLLILTGSLLTIIGTFSNSLIRYIIDMRKEKNNLISEAFRITGKYVAFSEQNNQEDQLELAGEIDQLEKKISRMKSQEILAIIGYAEQKMHPKSNRESEK